MGFRERYFQLVYRMEELKNSILTFKYPATLDIVRQLVDERNMDIEFENAIGGENVGRLIVKCSPCDQIVDCNLMIDAFVSYLLSFGLHVPNASVMPAPLRDGFDACWLFFPESEIKNSKMETPLMIYANKKWVVQIGLIGPSQELSPVNHLANQKAFQTIRDTLVFN